MSLEAQAKTSTLFLKSVSIENECNLGDMQQSVLSPPGLSLE